MIAAAQVIISSTAIEHIGVLSTEQLVVPVAAIELVIAIVSVEHVVAIAWTLTRPAVSCALVGIRRLEHLEGLQRAVELALDAETMERLEQIFDINHGRPLKRGPAPEAVLVRGRHRGQETDPVADAVRYLLAQ